VETPGTAPGSDPRITSAFMSIVPKDYLVDRRQGRSPQGVDCGYRGEIYASPAVPARQGNPLADD